MIGERFRRTAGQPRPDNDDLELAAIVRANQPRIIFMSRPLVGQRAVWNSCIEMADHNCCAGLTRPIKTATGIEV